MGFFVFGMAPNPVGTLAGDRCGCSMPAFATAMGRAFFGGNAGFGEQGGAGLFGNAGFPPQIRFASIQGIPGLFPQAQTPVFNPTAGCLGTTPHNEVHDQFLALKLLEDAKTGNPLSAAAKIEAAHRLLQPDAPFIAAPVAQAVPPPRPSEFKINEDGSVETKRYRIVAGEDSVQVFDKQTGKWFKAFGDPHLATSDGDKAQFHSFNLTTDLEDGVKLTIEVTEKDKNGMSWIKSVHAYQGDDAVTIGGFRDGTEGNVVALHQNKAMTLDSALDDGTVLKVRPGGEIDDLYSTKGELVGQDRTQRFNEHMLDGLGGVSSLGVPDAPTHPPVGGEAGDFSQIIASTRQLIDTMVQSVTLRMALLQELNAATAHRDRAGGGNIAVG